MNDVLSTLISKNVSDVIANNRDQIQEAILAGTNDDMTEQKLYAKMLSNSIEVFVQCSSVKMVLAILDESGVLTLDDDEERLRRLLLSSLKV